MAMDKQAVLVLVEEAARADHEMKSIKIYLDEAKSQLADWYLENKSDGKKIEVSRAEVVFAESDVFDAFTIMTLYDMLKKRGKEGELFQVVKPDIAALRKVLGADDIKELQGAATAVKVSVRLKWKG